MALVASRRAPVLPVVVQGAGVDVTEAAAASTAVPAAAEPTKGPGFWWMVTTYVVVLGAAAIAWFWIYRGPAAFTPASGFSIFAPLYLLAQGIERLIEPFTEWGGKKEDAKNDRDKKVADMLTDPASQPKRNAAAKAQSALEGLRQNTALITWAAASILALFGSAAFGLQLFASVGFKLHAFWDLLLTALAVGSGTKPLHDLISNLEKAKNDKADPPEAVTQS